MICSKLLAFRNWWRKELGGGEWIYNIMIYDHFLLHFPRNIVQESYANRHHHHNWEFKCTKVRELERMIPTALVIQQLINVYLSVLENE